MNLVDQIFEQAKAGSAQGQGFGQFFAEGVSAGQRQQQLDMQRQELTAKLAQVPLQQTLLQQQADLNALKIEQGLRDNQDAIEGHSLMAQYARVMQGANLLPIESGLRVHSQFGLDHPVVLTNPDYMASGKQLDERVKQADLQEYRLSIADARGATASAAQTRAEADKLKAELEAKGKADVMPKLVNVGGLNYIVNTKTGHFEPVNKTEGKAAFISKHLLNFSKDNMVDPKEAAAKLGELYDSMIAPAARAPGVPPAPSAVVPPPTAAPAPAPTAAARPPLRLGTVVVHNGERYIYRGGPEDDEASFVKAAK